MLKLLLASGLIFSNFTYARAEPDHIMLKPDDIQWAEGPSSLPVGAKYAILFGDPKAPGPFSMRLKFPAHYQIPPHFHPQDENITVISGTFLMAVGNDTNSTATELPSGSFSRMKARVQHFAYTKTETIVQINGLGPWGITYVNPAYDPRNQPKRGP